ncbi:MAG TPA: penicillin-binding transpeptidase domain-containing protein [Solirubrobacterales bacterium]|nr:penicillin-binding transpeptidase domain-containing protein [Solirubrobacterales bacterium]
MTQNSSSVAKRRRLLLIPLAIACAIAFIAGAAVAGSSAERDAAERFGSAWADGDYGAMYDELNTDSQSRVSRDDFEAAYSDAMATATATDLAVDDVSGPDDVNGEDVVTLATTVHTNAFGEVTADVQVPVADGGVSWQPNLVFPGLAEGDELVADTKLGKRAPILARDGSVLASGPASARATNGSGGIVTGETGTPGKTLAARVAKLGYPEDVEMGTSGLELAFDSTLAGTPGGKLLAVGKGGKAVLAKRAPTPGEPLKTTIDAKLQDATAAALGSTFGGAAVLDAKNGNVLALAGLAFSAPQPPGSTFKVITASAALEDGKTKLDEQFPVQTSTVAGGREIANAHDEACGGDLVESFAHSCNTVFAPLGVRVGGDKLVEESEQYGFNSPPTIYNPNSLALTRPPESTIPNPLEDDTDVAVSAIGQGEVLATPLEMAAVSQAVANRGVRAPNAMVKDPELAGGYPDVEVMPPGIAAEVKKMMIAVVASGTGSSAALPDVTVAGKTGTAELGTVDGSQPVAPGEDAEQDVDAWFTAFAPADNPKLAVAVMVVNAPGDGGTVAAPIARQILEAGL